MVLIRRSEVTKPLGLLPGDSDEKFNLAVFLVLDDPLYCIARIGEKPSGFAELPANSVEQNVKFFPITGGGHGIGC